MSDRPAAVISDANVLIDYIQVERTLVLRLVSEHLFPIKLPRAILNEVNQLTQDQAEALGMEIIEETYKQLMEASVRGGPLSREDKLCYAIARDNNWAIWTSDKPLHKKCKTEDIPVYWGLQLMLELCQIGKLDPEYALEAAKEIKQVNERITKDIVRKFITKLKEGRTPCARKDRA
jgi:rRNA-processing protein FCF1